jgi:septal ring factor EnvC (AmiA/AmiB activator)
MRLITLILAAVVAVAAAAQTPDRAAADAMARRVNERIRALQAEADRLAAQSRTLLGDLRQLEIQRDIAAEKVKAADADVSAAQTALQQTSERLTALEQERESQLPDLKLRLVDIYKRGRVGYARMLVDVNGLREFARAMRAVAALPTCAGNATRPNSGRASCKPRHARPIARGSPRNARSARVRHC